MHYNITDIQIILLWLLLHVHNNYYYAAKPTQSESFRQVYSLNMTLPNQGCPDALKLWTAGSLRLCGKKIGFWPNSIAVLVNGQSYQQVQGKVTAYQYGKVDVFQPYSAVYHEGNNNIDGSYVDGVSITHSQNPRKHIWTYAIGVRGRGGWHYPSAYGVQPPEFVGENYFCSAGNPLPKAIRMFYPTRLWSNLLGDCTDI